MDLDLLAKGISQVSDHNKNCEGRSYMNREVSREGLASVLEVSCDKCDNKVNIESSTKIIGSGEMKRRYSVNVGAVWGQMATGRGERALNEALASINVPGKLSLT